MLVNLQIFMTQILLTHNCQKTKFLLGSMVPFSKSQKTFCPRKAVCKKLIPQSRPVILTSSQVLCFETSLFTRNNVGYRARNQQESFRAFEKRTPG